MGILLSRFRKKKTTIEILEDLDSKIKKIEQYGQNTEQTHKKIVGRLILISVLLYIVSALLFYFYFFPAALYEQLLYVTPLLIFPILIVFVKKLVTWYYKRKISRNHDKLVNMQDEKKKILDQVTETETYKKAKEILLKFAPDQLRTPLTPQAPVSIPSIADTPRRPSTPQAVVTPLPGAGQLRKRALTVSNAPMSAQIGRIQTGTLHPVAVAHNHPQTTPLQTGFKNINIPPSSLTPRSPLPRPILPQQRSYLDRLVEYLVGDGPSNRYALICRQCESHNGMALKEEFEYFGFRCCYCNFWNPARKQKPSAPKLELDTTASALMNFSSDLNASRTNAPGIKVSEAEVSSSPSSDTDSDIEVVEKQSEANRNEENSGKQYSKEGETIKNTETTESRESDENVDETVQSEEMEVDESPKK